MIKTSIKVLIIDDDKFFLEFYRSELTQYNFKVESAMDGQTGIDKAKEIKPDVIILDVILPKKDGFEVLHELKQDEKTKDIPVIIASVLNEKNDIDRLMSAGAAKTFNKLTNLPREVAEYIQNNFIDTSKIDIPKPPKPVTTVRSDQIDTFFKEGIGQIENSLMKLFSKKTHLEDINATLIPFSQFSKKIHELGSQRETIFVHTNLKAAVPGVAFISVPRLAIMPIIHSIGVSTSGKKMDLSLDDQVMEEFVNIVVNSFLNKFSNTTTGSILTEPAVIDSSEEIASILNKLNLPDNNLVVFLEESYQVEDQDLHFSLYIVFDQKLISK